MKTLLTITLSLLCHSASACECVVGRTMKDNFKQADYVVRVKVTAITDTLHRMAGVLDKQYLTARYPPFTTGFAPRLNVLKVYKGDLKEKTIVLRGEEYCADFYDLGKEYVLFVYYNVNSYYTHICEKNFEAGDLEAMKQLKEIIRKRRY